MASETYPRTDARVPLNRDRVLRAAVDLADRDGVTKLTMRNLASELGVEAMSLYYHVANKEAILDGALEVIMGEIAEAIAGLDPPSEPADWKPALRTRILTARETMLRHRWAPALLEASTSISPAMIRYFDGVLGLFILGGFSYDQAHHAIHALGSRALGFTQELFQPEDAQAGDDDASMAAIEALAAEAPHLVGMMMEVAHDDPDSTIGWCDDQVEFEFGLDLLLDGLDRLPR